MEFDREDLQSRQPKKDMWQILRNVFKKNVLAAKMLLNKTLNKVRVK